MSIRIYNVNETDENYISYKVFINKKEVKLDCARVSAVPFNRRWPGHQRQLDQTEMINLLSFATDEEVLIEIVPFEPFENAVIRPKSLGITPDISNGKISFKLKKSAYFTVEPYGRHNALHILADPILDYDADISSKDVIYYPAGVHEAGMIELKSNQTLFIDEGALVYGAVKAADAENIKIIGTGILDASHNKETILFDVKDHNNAKDVGNSIRIDTISLDYCENIEIDGITIRDSLLYNVRPKACRNLHIKNFKTIGNWRYNSDGIDTINCSDVLIENCFLRTFDDTICVKGFDLSSVKDKTIEEATYRNGKEYKVSKNITVRNCVLWNDWGKSLEIGAETRTEEIFNILFENCDIIHITGQALDCCNVDYADVHNVTYRNINVEVDDVVPQVLYQSSDDEKYNSTDESYNPAIIYTEVVFHAEYSADKNRRGNNRDIVFNNIHIYSNKKPKFAVFGCDEDHKTTNILIKDIYLNGKKITDSSEYSLFLANAENVVIE